MRVLLIDDHTLFGQGLKVLLTEMDADIECTIASTISAAIRLTGQFDLILLDLNMPDIEGLAGLAAVRTTFENVPVTIVSADENPQVIQEAVAAGAMGYVPKSSSPQVLMAAMRLVLAGGAYLPVHVLQKQSSAAPHQSKTQDQLSEKLTDRQVEVLLKVLQGKPNKVIAREMDLAEGTVKSHLSTAFRILEVTNRTAAVFKAAQLGLTAPKR